MSMRLLNRSFLLEQRLLGFCVSFGPLLPVHWFFIMFPFFRNPAAGQIFRNLPAGQIFLNRPAGQITPNRPAGQITLNRPAGQSVENRPAGQTGWLAGIKIVNEIRVQWYIYKHVHLNSHLIHVIFSFKYFDELPHVLWVQQTLGPSFIPGHAKSHDYLQMSSVHITPLNQGVTPMNPSFSANGDIPNEPAAIQMNLLLAWSIFQQKLAK